MTPGGGRGFEAVGGGRWAFGGCVFAPAAAGRRLLLLRFICQLRLVLTHRGCDPRTPAPPAPSPRRTHVAAGRHEVAVAGPGVAGAEERLIVGGDLVRAGLGGKTAGWGFHGERLPARAGGRLAAAAGCCLAPPPPKTSRPVCIVKQHHAP
jgi:hypothetical protein